MMSRTRTHLVDGNKCNPFIAWVYNRVRKNKNVIFVVNGETGSGKTYAAIELARRIAIKLGTHFTIQDNMDFNFIELLKKTTLKCNKKAGTVFLFEEVGSVSSGAASRTWQSQANALFLSFMQTTRHRRQILIFTCPDFAFLDAGARKLVHCQAEMAGIDFEKKVAKMKVYRLQKNPRDGRIYFKFIRYRLNGKVWKMKFLSVPKPPKNVCDDYEVLKTAYTTKLNNMIMESSKPKEEKGDQKFKTKANLEEFRKAWREEGLSDPRLCSRFGIGFSTCQNYKHLVRGEEEVEGVVQFKMPT